MATATVPLALGENTITVTCSNVAAGASDTVSVTRYNQLDVAITDPVDGSDTTAGQVNLSYTVNGGTAVPGDSTCEVTHGSSTSPSTDPGTNEVDLAPGENSVTVTCSNAVASASDTVTVTRNRVPSVSIVSPGDGFVTTGSRVGVEFVAEGFPEPECTVAGKVSESPAEVDLWVGENVVRVLCVNDAGEDSAEVTVTRNQAPSVRIDSPPAGFTTRGSEVGVRFTATGFPLPECEVNGRVSASPATVNLMPGSNTITVRCRNSTGSDQKSITVTRSRDPEPARGKPRISKAPKRVRLGGPIRFRLHCDTACRVAPTLRAGGRKRRLGGVRRGPGTHRIAYRLRRGTVRALVKRKRNHPRMKITLTLTPKSAVGSGKAIRVRIGRR